MYTVVYLTKEEGPAKFRTDIEEFSLAANAMTFHLEVTQRLDVFSSTVTHVLSSMFDIGKAP